MSDTAHTTHVGGAKITINPTPSEQITKASAKEVTVTDAQGRQILLKKPSPLANLDFAKAAGSDKLNILYLAEVAHLKFIASFDGHPVATPSTEGELRALYQRLGEDGNEAAMTGIAEHFGGATSVKTHEDELKNS